MEELKLIFAANLIKIRTAAGMTQAELAEKLNYSDKAVSKWERAESVPDIFVIKQMSELFGVKIDDMLISNEQWDLPQTIEEIRREKHRKGKFIILVSLFGIISAAVLAFVVMWLCNCPDWRIFVYALPALCATWIILNSVFFEGKNNRFKVMLLVLSVFAVIYVAMINFNPWQLFFAAVPIELVVWFSFKISERKNK